MAFEYYVRHEEQETGPFAFRDLIVLARDGKLAEADQVRYSWATAWQRADSLVGLFYMARRAAAALADALPAPAAAVDEPASEQSHRETGLRQSEAPNPDRQICGPIRAPEPIVEFPVSTSDDRPGWMKRLLFIRGRQKDRSLLPLSDPAIPGLPPAAEKSSATTDLVPVFHSGLPASANPAANSSHTQDLAPEVAASPQSDIEMSRSRWAITVASALASATSRRSGRRSLLRIGRLQKLFGPLLKFVPRTWRGDSGLRIGYRVACTIVFAAIVAASVDNWSEEEGRRFLRGDRQKTNLRMFPVVGKCGAGTYMFLMADLVLATGAVTWFAAGWLESHAE